MELLQFLISFFIKNYGGDKFGDIFNIFKDNSFDIKKVLTNLKPEMLEPIIKSFFNSGQNKTPTDFSVGENYKLDPIARIADKDIVYTLNRYFN